MPDLCAMYFKSSMRYNPAKDTSCGYYRLVESYRNIVGRVCHRTILNVGFLQDDLTPDHLYMIQKILTNRVEGKSDLFEQDDPLVKACVDKYWQEMIAKKRVDIAGITPEQKAKLVDIETIKHKDVREVGAEWMCDQALNQLQIKEFLAQLGWEEEKIQLAVTQIISRAVYPHSELRTSRWIQENSAVTEITGYPREKLTKDKLYQSAINLYGIKGRLEEHLSKKTNELFDIEDKIILYDLTNTYFEGEKKNSKLARFGRSKEKRSDARLIVLALVINCEGFIKFSSLFEGNTADSVTLPKIIDNIRVQTSSSQKAIVVLDAGIATEDNLKLLAEKGYDYVCVSRSKIKDYEVLEGSILHSVETKNKQIVSLQKVQSQQTTDYLLKIKSPGKRLKEMAMKTRFETQFEEELEKIKIGLPQKNKLKKADIVHQTIGRKIEKYPSAAKNYKIEVKVGAGNLATDIIYQKKTSIDEKNTENLGTYFIRTNLTTTDEQTVWKIYNTIREIESTFRALKTDLDLRPIYHKNDDATMAHLHMGLLAYWVVNTIRHQLKQKDIKHNWQEIVRIGNTKKIITTYGQNQNNQIVSIRRCSEPPKNLQTIYQALNYKFFPFVKRKSVVHSP
jgi:hypothetical protein